MAGEQTEGVQESQQRSEARQSGHLQHPPHHHHLHNSRPRTGSSLVSNFTTSAGQAHQRNPHLLSQGGGVSVHIKFGRHLMCHVVSPELNWWPSMHS